MSSGLHKLTEQTQEIEKQYQLKFVDAKSVAYTGKEG